MVNLSPAARNRTGAIFLSIGLRPQVDLRAISGDQRFVRWRVPAFDRLKLLGRRKSA